MSEYPGIGGHYWEKDAIVSRGEYFLIADDEIAFGEPLIAEGLDLYDIPQNKKACMSYAELAPGSVPALGVSIEWRRNISAWDAEDMALRGRQDFRRELTILKHGGCTVKNMGTGIILDGTRVIPCVGGCQEMTATGEYSLGIAKQDIEPLQYGLIQIQPDEEKAMR